MRRLIAISLVAVCLSILPLQAQQAQDTQPTQPDSPLNWIPADFAGFFRVEVTTAPDQIFALNNLYLGGSFLQPRRISVTQPRDYDDLLPLDRLDTENINFAGAILPWLRGEMVIAYQDFDSTFNLENALWILPATDALAAASYLSPVIQAQNLLERETYLDVTIYVGDQTSFAFTPTTVLVGSTPLVKAALDTRYANADRLIDTPAAAAMRPTIDESTVFAYLTGDLALPVLNMLLSGDATTLPLMTTLFDALRDNGLAHPIINREIDAVGVGITSLPLANQLRGAVLLAADEAPVLAPAGEAVLGAIPRSAMLVQTGADIRPALATTFLMLPLSSFANNILSGFMVDFPPEAALPPLTGDDLTQVVETFTRTLAEQAGFSLRDDLRVHLAGDYALALVPNLNDPTPGLKTNFDALLVAQVTDAEAALDGTTRLLELLLRREFEPVMVENVSFATIMGNEIGDPLLRVGVVDDLLIVGTGKTADMALRAHGGDNRLIDMPRWEAVSFEDQALLYVDLNTVTVLREPVPGGRVDRGVGQLGAQLQYADGLYRLDVRMSF